MTIAAHNRVCVRLSIAIVGRYRVFDMSVDGRCRPQCIVQAVHRQPFAAVCGGGLRAFGENQRSCIVETIVSGIDGGVLLGDEEQQCRRAELFRLAEGQSSSDWESASEVPLPRHSLLKQVWAAA